MKTSIQQDKEDLICAGIPFVHKKETDKNTEQVEGRLETKYGTFIVTRGRCYWMVKCHLPLQVAEKLYNHPEGRRSIRVAGHCMSPHPSEWVSYFNDKGKELGKKSELAKLSDEIKKTILSNNRYEFVDNPEKEKKEHLLLKAYHIDSQAGLLLFVQTVIE